MNTRMDILKNFLTILSTWDFEIWLPPPCEARVTQIQWGDMNPISTSTNNTPMPHTHTHWKKSIHGKETCLSIMKSYGAHHIHWMQQIAARKKIKIIIRSVVIFIGAEQELVEFWIQQQNYIEIVEKLGIHYPQ